MEGKANENPEFKIYIKSWQDRIKAYAIRLDDIVARFDRLEVCLDNVENHLLSQNVKESYIHRRKCSGFIL